MTDPSALKPDFSAVRNSRVLIALSGGADSVALAVMLCEARAALGLQLFAAHVDHGIRAESGRDADYCRRLCEGLHIPFLLAQVDAPARAARDHCGLETAARALRMEALERFRAEVGADYIALAHHMDDQAETVLMHLARGAGLEGLGGMRELNGRLYRPLLRFRKAALQAYLSSRGYEWREDATNCVADNPRNALRLNVIPALETCYPRFASAAARCAQTAQIESDYLDAQTRRWLDAHGAGGDYGRWLELDPPPPRAILRRAIRIHCPQALDWEQVNALEALCHQSRGKTDLGISYFAERTGHRLYFVPKRLPETRPTSLILDGVTELPGLCQIQAQPCEAVPIRDDPRAQALDAQALCGAVLRTRRAGDRFRPLGCGDRLLSDFLTDRKVDRPLRDATPILAVGNRVLWVCGLGISEDAALKPGSRAVRLEFTWEKTIYDGGKHHAE